MSGNKVLDVGLTTGCVPFFFFYGKSYKQVAQKEQFYFFFSFCLSRDSSQKIVNIVKSISSMPEHEL